MQCHSLCARPLSICREVLAPGTLGSTRLQGSEGSLYCSNWDSLSHICYRECLLIFRCQAELWAKPTMKETGKCEVPSIQFILNVAKWHCQWWELLALPWMACLHQADNNIKGLTIPLIIIRGLTYMGASHLAQSLPKELCEAELSVYELIMVWISVVELFSSCDSTHQLHIERLKTFLAPL